MDDLLAQIPTLDTTTRWWIVVATILTIIYIAMRPMRRKKDPLSRPAGQNLASQREVERHMNDLLIELSEMARQMTAQLDTRAAKLDLLIKQADERLAQLRSAAAQPAVERLPSRQYADIPAPAPVDPRHVEVYVLSDKGHNASDIAQRLSRPRGEVELILALRKPASMALTS